MPILPAVSELFAVPAQTSGLLSFNSAQ